MANVETLMSDLRTQGERRARSRSEAADAMSKIKPLARAAYAAGKPKAEIARAARISRVALDAILRE